MLIGTHEASQSVRKSVDGGNTFVNIGTTLPAGSARSEYPLIIDASTYLIGCSFTVSYGPSSAGGTPGLYRTTDGGAHWTQVATQSVFQQPLVTKDAIYWAFSSSASSGGILKSTDKGLTWRAMPADGIDYTAQPIALPDGSIAAVTTSHFVTVSTNGGTSWTNVTPAIPLTSPLGLTYDPTGQALFAWKKSGRVQRMAYPVIALDGGAAEAGSDAATPANDGATNDGATDVGGSGGAAGAGGAPRADAEIGGGGGGASGNVPGSDAAAGAGGKGAGGVTAGVGGQDGATPMAQAAPSGGCACATVPTSAASRVPLSMLFQLSLFAGAAAFLRRRKWARRRSAGS
jgi:hypothetical protein